MLISFLAIYTELVQGCSELKRDLLMCDRVKFDAATRISLHFKWIYDRKWESIFVEFLTEAGPDFKWLTIPRLSRHTVRPSLLNVDNHLCWVELINIKVEEFVYQLCHWLLILLFWHVKFLDNLQVIFEKCVGLIHTINLLVYVFGRIIVPPSFWVKFFNGNRVVHCLLPLIP